MALKYGVSNNKLVAGLVSSVIAMHIATITGFWYQIIHLPAVDWNRFNGTYLIGGAASTASDFEVFVTGWVFHSFTGIALGLAFVFLIRPKLPFAYTMMGNLLAAIVMGVALALLSMFVITPYLNPYASYGAHPGFMSLDLKLADNFGNFRPGWQTPLVILIWHLVWGVQMGAFYNPNAEAEAEEVAAGIRPAAFMSSAPMSGGTTFE